MFTILAAIPTVGLFYSPAAARPRGKSFRRYGQPERLFEADSSREEGSETTCRSERSASRRRAIKFPSDYSAGTRNQHRGRPQSQEDRHETSSGKESRGEGSAGTVQEERESKRCCEEWIHAGGDRSPRLFHRGKTSANRRARR